MKLKEIENLFLWEELVTRNIAPPSSEEEMEARFRKELMMVDQSWLPDWGKGEFSVSDVQRARLKNADEKVKKLMFAFPPLCVVRATIPLKIPQQGTLGIVIAYTGMEHNEIVVKQSPEAEFSATLDPRVLEVTGYYKGLTPAALSAFF